MQRGNKNKKCIQWEKNMKSISLSVSYFFQNNLYNTLIPETDFEKLD